MTFKNSKSDRLFLALWGIASLLLCARFVLRPGLVHTREPQRYMDWWDMRLLEFLGFWIPVSLPIFVAYAIAKYAFRKIGLRCRLLKRAHSLVVH